MTFLAPEPLLSGLATDAEPVTDLFPCHAPIACDEDSRLQRAGGSLGEHPKALDRVLHSVVEHRLFGLSGEGLSGCHLAAVERVLSLHTEYKTPYDEKKNLSGVCRECTKDPAWWTDGMGRSVSFPCRTVMAIREALDA